MGDKAATRDARAIAVKLLRGVLKERRSLSDHRDLSGIGDPATLARAQRLATACSRHLGRLDMLLSAYLERPPPLEARNILRLAALELCYFREAPHGVVDSAVSLMRRSGQGKYAGLANAVLRKVAQQPEALEQIGTQPLPGWLRRRLVHIYDDTITNAMEAVFLQEPPLDLSLKPGIDPAPLADQLGADILPGGTLRLRSFGQVSELAGFDQGAWWVQDWAASQPVRLLGEIAGARILDLCAAPGGKTLQLAARGAEVTALDVSEPRMKRVSENLRRTGLSAELVTADALTWAGGGFDVVLLDAPCSATGTIRRHPELPLIRNGKDLDEIFALQARLLERAIAAVKPGGRIVFATCSLLTEEGERPVRAAIEKFGLQALAPDFRALGLDPDWTGRGGLGLRLRPDFWAERGGMDGFFTVLLQKPV